MQACQRVGEAQQSDGPRHEEEGPGGDRGDGKGVKCDIHLQSVASAFEDAASADFLTKATEAKLASSASIKATSTIAVIRVAATASSNTAAPPVPSSCAAIMRSASVGPRRIRTNP